MELKTFFAQDLTGRIISNPLVFIYQVGTQVPVSGLTGVNGESLTNPFSGNSIGKITVALPGGEYDMRILSSIREYTVRVRFIDEDTVGDGSKSVDIASEQRDIALGQLGEVLDVVGSDEEFRGVLGEVRASVGQAKGSVALADVVLSNNRAIEASKANAAAQASLAEGYAANAYSVLQQDLSGVTSEALHRSPNAVTAMFVYDTSKDSDGGAWTEKCEGTSWYNEPMMGKWLGVQPSELNARNEGAVLGDELLPDPDLNSTIGIATSTVRYTVTAGRAIRENNANAASLRFEGSFTAGKTYRVAVEVASTPPAFVVSASPVFSVDIFNQGLATNATTGVQAGKLGSTLVFYITPTVTCNRLGVNSTTSTYADIEAVSVREVTALTTSSGNYYQSTVDGKFYRLWKNLINRSSTFGGFGNGGASAALTAVANSGPSGSSAYKLVPYVSAATVGDINTTWSGVASASTRYSFSIKAKAGEYPRIGVRGMYNATTGYMFHGTIDLTTGIAVSNIGLYPVTATPDPRGGGYYIIKVEGLIANIGTGLNVALEAHDANSTAQQNFAADGTSGIFITEPQYESGPIATAYEENANTTTTTETFRGNKRKFPKLAGIVAEGASASQSLTIYDLTEPERPMWMRFAGSSSTATPYLLYTGGSHSLSASNAKLAIGAVNTGMILTDFCRDSATRYSSNNNLGYWLGSGLAERNLKFWTIGNNPTIVNVSVNAVAMTVLPDAPTDPVTGLKVPTIAVATGGGVSVIKHNGTVVNNTAGFLDSVTINPYLLTAARSYSNADHFIAFNPGNLPAGFSWSSSYVNQFDVTGSTARMAGKGRSVFLKANSNRLVARLLDSAMGLVGKHLSSLIAPTFNTGHLTGDIRRAYLSDVDVGSVSGPELVVNGGFDTDTAGWSVTSGGSLSIANGRLRVTNDTYASSAWVDATQVIPTQIGARYLIKVDGYAGNLANNPYRMEPGPSVLIGVNSIAIFVATTSTTTIRLRPSNSSGYIPVGGYCDFDNISVREVVVDRSYKAQSANITGTLTKSPVASAAQMVAYSGFSNANYLREPYSADLDFGVGEWSVGAWVNVPAVLPQGSFPVSSEMFTTFSGVGSGWGDNGNGSWSIASAVAETDLFVAFAGTVGKTYRIAFVISGVSGAAPLVYPLHSNPSNYTNGSYSFVLESASTYFIVRAPVGSSSTISGISIREAGSLRIADRAHSIGTAINISVLASGKLTATAHDGTTTRTVTTTAAYNTGTWLKAEADYTTDGTLSISVNGVEVAATRGNPLLSLNSRYNQLLYTRDLTNAAWSKRGTGSVSNTTAPDGTGQLVSVTNTGNDVFQTFAAITGQRYEPTLMIWPLTTTGVLNIQNPSNMAGGLWSINMATLTPDAWNTITRTHPSTTVVNEFTGSSGGCGLFFLPNDGLNKQFYIKNPQVSLGALLAVYQYVNAATDFDFAAPLTIGNSFAADAPFPGSIALLKLSATVPTQEQSIWMYEQEKQMFREGAQVTIPDSGVITDLTYDDASDTWIASSETNISEFSGLVRTNVTPVPAGSFTKVSATSGVRLHARSTTNPGVDVTIPSIELRTELAKRAENVAKLNSEVATFDFDSITGQTDFALPTGYSAIAVRVSGERRREGATKDFTRLFDGFKETIRFGVAPGNAVWVQIKATKSIN